MAADTAARPHELLNLKIKDVVFKIAPDTKQQYAEVLVNGKTETRHIPLINSIPYLKDWLDHGHPQSGNPNSILLCGYSQRIGRTINVASLARVYREYKEKYFPKLLGNPNVPEKDKQQILELLKEPWNPYIRRHSALTDLSGILKEHHLRQYAGWTPRSMTHLKYIHYFGNEASESLLNARGILTQTSMDEKKNKDMLRAKPCPNCFETNKPDSKFCDAEWF
jgi:integrase